MISYWFIPICSGYSSDVLVTKKEGIELLS